MTWVRFSDKKPPEGEMLITRCPDLLDGDCIQDFRIWVKSKMSLSPIFTHWWQGSKDINLAKEHWKNNL